ncbi:MAG: 30S ribosomal protein S8 [Actinobacteria bacterium]|nr:30S ribosomal protein S8 [Actinomycetota bacterium]
MVMTDPIADMLTRIRNASMASKEQLQMPASSLRARIADILVREGYLGEAAVEGDGKDRTITIRLKYGPNRERTINGIKRVSRPGRRIYAGRDDLPRVLNGLGIAILSTSQGLLTDRQAKRQGVGGEVLAYVW